MYFKKAFTLIEILLVIAVISMVVSVVFPYSVKLFDKFNTYIEKAENRRNEKLKEFKKFLNDE